MDKKILKVLLIEDNAGDAFLMKFYIGESQAPKFDITHVETIAAAFEQLNNTVFDIVLMDLNLPDSLGMESVKKLMEKYPDNLVIVLTGLIDERVGLETVRYGAQDFLVKGKFDSKVLISSITFAFERYHLNKSLKSANTKISEDTRRFNNLQIVHQIGYFEFEKKTKALYVSDYAQKMLYFSYPRNILTWEEIAVKIENPNIILNAIADHSINKNNGLLHLVLIEPRQEIEVSWKSDDEYYFGSIKTV